MKKDMRRLWVIEIDDGDDQIPARPCYLFRKTARIIARGMKKRGYQVRLVKYVPEAK